MKATLPSVSVYKILQFFFWKDYESSYVGAQRCPLSLQSADGPFERDNKQQGYLLSSFFWCYVITQIPFGILAKRYGAKYFLGIGMLINSLFGLLVPLSANWGYWPLIIVRFIQGLGEVSNISKVPYLWYSVIVWLRLEKSERRWECVMFRDRLSVVQIHILLLANNFYSFVSI